MERAKRFLECSAGWPLWLVVLFFIPLVMAMIAVEMGEEAGKLGPEELSKLSQDSML